MVADTVTAWDERARTADTAWDAALWSEHGQTRRFLTAAAHLNLRAGETVLDYGCGTGRLSEFVPRDVSYVGYDRSTEMVARAAVEHPARRFGTTLPGWRFNAVVCIGTWNLGVPADAWAEIDRLWAQTAQRVLVASLHRDVFPIADVAAHADRLTGRYLIDGTHLTNDLMLVLHR